LVFLPDGTGIDSVVRGLRSAGFREALALHEATEQPGLIEAYAAAAQGDTGVVLPILVASEASARGLHFEGIDAVFVLSRPQSPDEYLHLAGRTGRGGRPGKAISIVSYSEASAIEAWSKQLRFEVTKRPEIEVDG